MNRPRKPFFPIILIFAALNALFIAGRKWMEKYGVSQELLLAGNVFLFLVTIGSYLIAQRGLSNKNPNAFVRSVYASIMLKLFLCLIAAFIYIAIVQKGLNKPAFFILMGLYLVYTFIEVGSLTRQLRAGGGRPAPQP